MEKQGYIIKNCIFTQPSINKKMKNRFILLLLIINLTACSVFRPASRNSDNLSASGTDRSSDRSSQPVFIQDISTETSSGSTVKTNESPSPAPRGFLKR